jgi:hypothetical protein
MIAGTWPSGKVGNDDGCDCLSSGVCDKKLYFMYRNNIPGATTIGDRNP